MKYYCKKCGSILIIGEGIDATELFEDGMLCPFDFTHGEMKPNPDYETPEQYEKRTGKPVSEDTAVWAKQTYISDWDNKKRLTEWILTKYEAVKKIKKSILENKFGSDALEIIAVIADPPVPPPDGWKPGAQDGQ
jgi:hypothetical protein